MIRSTSELECSRAEAADSNYIPIEVQGITYIYNPPNMSQAGTGLAGGGPAAATATRPRSLAGPGHHPAKLPPIGGPAAGVPATPATPATPRGSRK